MGPKYTIVLATLHKPEDSKSGLGISLEGTVDVEDGREVRPHHYIRDERRRTKAKRTELELTKFNFVEQKKEEG